MSYQRPGLRALLAGGMLASLLAACGGGGGGDASPAGATTSSGAASTPAAAPHDAPVATLLAACTGCGTVDAKTYAGSGVGLWQASNTGGASVDVPVAIGGLAGQDVTLVFTNEAAADVAFPATNNAAQPQQLLLSQDLRAAPAAAGEADPQQAIREFNRQGWAERLAQARAHAEGQVLRSLVTPAPLAATYAVGATRTFHHYDDTQRTATLQKQLQTADGTRVNVWVESSEIGAGKVTAAMSDQLASSFARAGGIHDMIKTVGGPLWGPHAVAGLISGTGQPVDIVVLNFDRNAKPYGTVGFFWSLHHLLKSVDSRSNESLSVYLDAETLYLDGERGARTAAMTLTHEALHMANFYRRGVLMGPQYQFDTWLEEMTAMMMEDAAAAAIDAGYSPIRDDRLQDYLQYGSYNCGLRNWTPYAGSCESYAVSGSFGGFLLRQLGVGFYRDLLRQPQAGSEAALQAAIRAVRPDSGLGEQLRRFGASAIGLLPATSPAGYGFPARTDTGFALSAIDASRLAALRTLPAGSPTSLLAYGNFPVVRRAVTGTFSETVRVPPGATLSVVIH